MNLILAIVSVKSSEEIFLFITKKKGQRYYNASKISKEVRQRIYDLKDKESKSVKEILGILKSEGVEISDKSIYNILKEKTNNRSMASFDEEEEKSPFNESFGEENILRNYIDCFSDNEIIQSMCCNPILFKQKLYEKDLAGLTVIYEEIQIGINQSKDFEQFMYMFSSTLQVAEFVSSLLLGLNITGLKDELLGFNSKTY